MKSLLRVSMLLAMGGGLAAFQAPQLPPPFHSESVNNGPTVIARPEGVQLKLPPGLKIEAARFKSRNIRATIAADVKRFGHQIKRMTFSAHTTALAQVRVVPQAVMPLPAGGAVDVA